MSAAVERRHWHFTGSVQGVGFRYRAQYAAQLLDLTGWVENNWDGTVDLEAQGSYRIILSADTASEVRQMPSQKRR